METKIDNIFDSLEAEVRKLREDNSKLREALLTSKQLTWDGNYRDGDTILDRNGKLWVVRESPDSGNST